jgi:hypothetical protein
LRRDQAVNFFLGANDTTLRRSTVPSLSGCKNSPDIETILGGLILADTPHFIDDRIQAVPLTAGPTPILTSTVVDT